MTRVEYLEKAKHCINGDRDEHYGQPEDNFGVIASLWSVYTGFEFTPEDVAIMMALFKIGRISSGQFVPDNFVDTIGYMACAGEMIKDD